MRPHSLLIAALFPFSLLQAQDCSEMKAFFKEGVTLEYANINKKGKTESTYSHRVDRLETVNDTLIVQIDMKAKDSKGKETFSNQYPMKCYQGAVYLDMRNMVPANTSAQQNAEMHMTFTGDDMLFPSDMSAGQTLPECRMRMTTSMGSLALFTSEFVMYNRKVEGSESLTTPAGTFNCVKITYDFDYNALGKRTLHCRYWYSKGLGMVKSETYNGRGELENKSELVKVGE